ncbi:MULTISPECIES: WH2 domain-containing protein [unclassified Wolbachia]|uniref:WH2 domain-containing protein n=1 Tax=unclassified Wolbachia TaxID=2640676 RepID=UPI00221F3636|nr:MULTISPECIES: WH2 domain-containing protein [unclassified Wolbachia]
MLTNNNNTPSSAPPPPPPLPPADWGENWKPAKNNDKNENTLGSTPSKTSNSTQLKRGPSEVTNPNLLEDLKNKIKHRKEEEKENNASDKTANKGSKNSIHVKNPETRNSAQSKEEDNASDKTKNDRSNTKQVVPKKPMTGQHNGVQSDSENQKSSVAEQKKATALKYSIAILLLCISGPVAGVCTYFIISAVLSSAAVPVLFAVIASVSALVMLSSAAYLINSHLSAINSEKKVDPGRKQSQDLQKAKGLEHSNTYTSSLPVTLGTPSAPTPLTLKNNTTNKSIPSGCGKQQGSGDLMADLNKTLKSRRKAIDGEDDVQQQNNEVCQNQSQDSSLQKAKELEHSNTPTPSFPVMSGTPSAPPPPPPPLPQSAVSPPSPPSAPDGINSLKKTNGADKPGAEVSNNANQSDAKNAMLAQIKQGVKLKKVVDQPEAAKKPSNKGGGDLMKNALATMKNSPLLGEGTKSSDSKSDDEDDDQNRTPDSEWEDESPTPQSDSNKRSESPDSGHESDDNEKSKPTSPLHSVPKAGKPLVPPKTAGLQTKSEASPGAQAKNVDPVNSEVEKPSSLVSQNINLFGGKAHACQLKSVTDRGKRK